MTESTYCKAGYCKYKLTHVTKGHKCGICGKFGHGNAECNNNISVYKLEKFHNEILPNDIQCTVYNCWAKEYHTIDAHYCPNCGVRDPHDSDSCKKTYNISCPICRTHNTITNPVIIKGLSDECCICYATNVEILFPACKHCVICMECLDKM